MADQTAEIGIGLIGCGGFGEFCLDAFSDLPGVRPAAVADVVKQAADRLGERFGVPAFGEPEELIGHPDVDLVHVATPPGTHHELVLAALRKGKHVLCEKPLAMNLVQADEMLRAAAEADRIVPVNFVLRYNAVTDAVRAVIDSGVLGRVLAGRLTNCATDSKLPPGHWFWDPEMGGGIFIEHGVHFFDLYRYWLGEGEVLAAEILPREGTGQADRVHCTFRTAGGALVSHYHAFDQIAAMDRTDHRLACELGDIRVEGWIPLTVVVDVATDAAGQAALLDCLPDAGVEMLGELGGTDGGVMGRGVRRGVDRRIRLTWTPREDKQAVYTDSVRGLLADQLAYVRDRCHPRVITEANGREAVALAQRATELAGE